MVSLVLCVIDRVSHRRSRTTVCTVALCCSNCSILVCARMMILLSWRLAGYGRPERIRKLWKRDWSRTL